MKLTRDIQMFKNIFAMKMLLTVFAFYVQDLPNDCGYFMFYVKKWLEEYWWL